MFSDDDWLNIELGAFDGNRVLPSIQNKFDMKVTTTFSYNIWLYAEKIGDLEEKLKYDEDEIQRKNRVISELEAQLEAAKISTACQAQIDEISMPEPKPCWFNSF